MLVQTKYNNIVANTCGYKYYELLNLNFSHIKSSSILKSIVLFALSL